MSKNYNHFDYQKYARIEAGISPCADCLNRKVGCHSRCADYAGWKQRYNDASNVGFQQYMNDMKRAQKGLANAMWSKTSPRNPRYYQMLKIINRLLGKNQPQ